MYCGGLRCRQSLVDNCLRFLLLPFSVKTNGLCDGEYMPFVECFVECRTAVPGCSKHNALRRYRRIRYIGIISRYKFGYVNQHCWFGRLSCKRTYFHAGFLNYLCDIFSRATNLDFSLNLRKARLQNPDFHFRVDYETSPSPNK